jgi:hypothetical protein
MLKPAAVRSKNKNGSITDSVKNECRRLSSLAAATFAVFGALVINAGHTPPLSAKPGGTAMSALQTRLLATPLRQFLECGFANCFRVFQAVPPSPPSRSVSPASSPPTDNSEVTQTALSLCLKECASGKGTAYPYTASHTVLSPSLRTTLMRNGEFMSDDVLSHVIGQANALIAQMETWRAIMTPAEVEVLGTSGAPSCYTLRDNCMAILNPRHNHWVLLVNTVVLREPVNIESVPMHHVEATSQLPSMVPVSAMVSSRLCLYDSNVHSDADAALRNDAHLRGCVDGLFGAGQWRRVEFPQVQQQEAGSNLCGFFCVAWMAEILLNHTMPDFVVFDQSRLRSHLVGCMQCGLSVFPHEPVHRDWPNYLSADVLTQAEVDAGSGMPVEADLLGKLNQRCGAKRKDKSTIRGFFESASGKKHKL